MRSRVTVVGSVCLCVCQHLTSRASFRPENHITYATGQEGQNICGVFSETALLERSSTPSLVWPYMQSAIFKAHALMNEACQLAVRAQVRHRHVNLRCVCEFDVGMAGSQSTGKHNPGPGHVHMQLRRGFALQCLSLEAEVG